MERDRSATANPNQRLSQYVFQMQSKVGYSEKTLYQISSEYLQFKTHHPDLVQDIEELEVNQADQLNPDQIRENCAALRRLQDLWIRCLTGYAKKSDHPWFEFAHHDHQSGDYEHLLRTLRFVSIQLNKFWIEIQSFPVFLNTVSGVSIKRIEEILEWLQTGPAWHEVIQQPRLIPLLIQEEAKKSLMEFKTEIERARGIKFELEAQNLKIDYFNPIHLEEVSQLMGSTLELIKKHQLAALASEEVLRQIQQIQTILGQAKKAKQLSVRIEAQYHAPGAQTFREALLVFRAIRCASRLPEPLMVKWRVPQLLQQDHKSKFLSWKKEALDLSEMKKRLESDFRVDDSVDLEHLEGIISGLKVDGMLRSFSKEFRNAVKAYAALHKNEESRSKMKDEPEQMIQRLSGYVDYLQRLKAFKSHSEMQALFGSLYSGTETDFNSAIEVNEWSVQVRKELAYWDSSLGKGMADFVFTAPFQDLKLLTDLFSQPEVKDLEDWLGQNSQLFDEQFDAYIQREESRSSNFEEVLRVAETLGVPNNARLAVFEKVYEQVGELTQVMKQMNSGYSELKQAFKGDFKGVDTDLSLIEQVSTYVEYVQAAPIPDDLKAVFLTTYGPPRFGENRALAASALSSLRGLHELMQRLDTITLSQTREVLHHPIPKLLTLINQALRQPGMLGEWVEYLRCEKTARGMGLGEIVDYFHARGLAPQQLELAYQIAVAASLIKKALSRETSEVWSEASRVH